ncbi:MAG: hypothetical protein ACRDSR_26620 [Pseudonocardiaceae bacterium]
MRDVSSGVGSIFDDSEISELEANKLMLGGNTERNTIDLAAAWAENVQKIDLDRALPSSDRSVWNEHDLAGTLFLRDHLDESLSQLRPALRERMERYVAETDERFRSFTMDDPGRRMARVADVDTVGRSWWWFRVPVSGPIAQDLSRYQDLFLE